MEREERVFVPMLVRQNREGVASLEIAVDHLPQDLSLTVFDELLRFTRDWVEREGFLGKATLWQWFCPDSADFTEFGGPVAAEFVCMVGLPEECRNYVVVQLRKLLGKAFRYPADPLTRENIKNSRCIGYVEYGSVWQPLDAVTWVVIG